MSSRFVNGTVFAVAPLSAVGVAISAITNAKPGVATTATPPTKGDILVLKSNWPSLNEVPVRAGDVTASTFVLEGYDTTNVTEYPAGEGGGVYHAVGPFTNLSQVRDVATEGGDQNYFEWQYVEDKSRRMRRKPTYKSAMSYSIVMDEDVSLPWFEVLKQMDKSEQLVVLRETMPNGSTIYYVGNISFNHIGSKALNQNTTVTATFSINSDIIRYEA